MEKEYKNFRNMRRVGSRKEELAKEENEVQAVETCVKRQVRTMVSTRREELMKRNNNEGLISSKVIIMKSPVTASPYITSFSTPFVCL